MKRIKREKLLCLTLMVFGFLSFSPQPISADFYVIPVRTLALPRVKTIQVDCNAGQTINSALEKANPGDTIQVQGTCNEAISLIAPNHDRLKIDGLGTAIIDGGGQNVITINSAQGVVINGITVQNGNEGIISKGGAAFTAENVTVLDNTVDGILLDENSTAQLTDCTVERSGDWGIGALHSNLSLNGNIVCNNNGGFGIGISNSSSAVFGGASITTNYNNRGIQVFNSSGLIAFNSTITTNNNDRGIQVFNSSSLSSSASTITTNDNMRGVLIGNSSSLSSNASTITFQNNSLWGLQLVGTSSVYTSPDTTMTIRNSDRGFQLHGSSYAEITGSLLVEDSGNRGIFVTLNSTIEIGDPANITVRSSAGNGYGIDIYDGSSVNGQGGSLIVENNMSDGVRATKSSRFRAGTNFMSQIRNNGGRGVWLNDGSSADCSNSTITGNAGGDIVLSFGSRASLYGGTIGTISCDGTVLISGDYVCPQ